MHEVNGNFLLVIFLLRALSLAAENGGGRTLAIFSSLFNMFVDLVLLAVEKITGSDPRPEPEN